MWNARTTKIPYFTTGVTGTMSIISLSHEPQQREMNELKVKQYSLVDSDFFKSGVGVLSGAGLAWQEGNWKPLLLKSHEI